MGRVTADKTCLALNTLYNDTFTELNAELEALGGYVTYFSPEDYNVKFVIDPKLQTHAEECITTIIIRYKAKHKKIMDSDVFIGLKLLLYTLRDTED